MLLETVSPHNIKARVHGSQMSLVFFFLSIVSDASRTISFSRFGWRIALLFFPILFIFIGKFFGRGRRAGFLFLFIFGFLFYFGRPRIFCNWQKKVSYFRVTSLSKISSLRNLPACPNKKAKERARRLDCSACFANMVSSLYCDKFCRACSKKTACLVS